MKCAEKSALEDIPFDLKHYPHIIYGGSIALLKSQLEKRIRWCIENPKDSLSNVDINLNFFMNGIPLINTPEISPLFNVYEYSNIPKDEWDAAGQMTLGVHNMSNLVTKPDDFSLSLISPKIVTVRMYREDAPRPTFLPDGQLICILQQPELFSLMDGMLLTLALLLPRMDLKKYRLICYYGFIRI